MRANRPARAPARYPWRSVLTVGVGVMIPGKTLRGVSV